MSILAIPVNTIYLGVMRMDSRHGYGTLLLVASASSTSVIKISTHSVVPNVHYFPMGCRDEVIVPSVPLHLSTGCSPVTKAHDRSVKASQVPSPYAGVHGDGRHQVRIERMPVDICDGS